MPQEAIQKKDHRKVKKERVEERDEREEKGKREGKSNEHPGRLN